MYNPAEHLRKFLFLILKKINSSFSFPRRVINIPMIPQVFFCEEYVETDGPLAVCSGLGGVMVRVAVIFGCGHGEEIQT